MARTNRKPTGKKKASPRKDKKTAAVHPGKALVSLLKGDEARDAKRNAPRKDELLTGTMKEQLQGIVNHLTPSLRGWIDEGAEEESKLKAAKITLELLEFVQPKLTRVVLSEAEAGAIARGVGAELRKQLAARLLQDVPTGD